MAQRRLSDQQRLDWLQLILSENVGPASFRDLINYYGGAGLALDALPALSRQGGLKRSIKLYHRDRAKADLERADRLGARFIALGEPDYPDLLNHIPAAPPLLCVKGRLELLSSPVAAIVGARNASALGRKLARTIAAGLGNGDFVVASGLARGIDTAAHEAAVKSGTIAVLAGGIDHIYPRENEALYDAISNDGVLISEMPPGYQPQSRDFPRRNRLISGLSLGVIVIEAAKRSGSLITARFALEQGREVFAVPGSPLDARAHGTNDLIKQGATVTTSAQDVLDVLAPMVTMVTGDTTHNGAFSETPEADIEPRTQFNGTGGGNVPQSARDIVVQALGPSPVAIDDLARECSLATSDIHIILVELELAGRLIRHDNNMVALSDRHDSD